MELVAPQQLALVLLGAACAQVILLGCLLLSLLRQRRLLAKLVEYQPDPAVFLDALRPLLAEAHQGLAEELTCEVAVLREAAAHLHRAAADLKSSTARGADDPAVRRSDAWRARDEARCLLQAGCGLDEVCERTGVPHGELQLLSALRPREAVEA